MPLAVAISPTAELPTTEEAIEFLENLRRELRFDERFDRFVGEALRFVVRGIAAPRTQSNPSPGTACWSFRGVPGAHLIHFCLTALNKLVPGSGWQGYITCYAHHEFCHACLTVRDLRKMNKLLEKHGLPFRLFNIFEDARIEHYGREKFGFPMKWLDYETLTPASDPNGYYFNLIQNRGIHSDDLLIEAVLGEAWVKRVRDYYYAKTIATKTSAGLIPLMKEWKAEFGKKEDGLPMDLAMSLGLTQEVFDALVQLAQLQSGEEGEGGGPREEVDEESVESEPDTSNHGIIASGPVQTLDHDLAGRVADRLSSLLAPTETKERTCHASKRLSTRAYIAGRSDFYRRRTCPISGGKGRPVEIAYLIDCSGSMRGVIAIGIAIAMGLNLMARRGLVTGHVILHQIVGGKSRCASYAFPLPDSFFERIPNNGGAEGIEPALKLSLPTLLKCDFVFCYTDGRITDAPVDRAWLASHNIRPIGLYCGDESMAPTLKSWFPLALIREQPMDLLEAIVATVDFKSFARK